MQSPSQRKDQAYQELVEKASHQVGVWTEMHQQVNGLLETHLEPKFEEIQDLLLDQLTSHACAVNQGYVMHGFSLDFEKASSLFLEKTTTIGEPDFNELVRPDFVVIVNRELDKDNFCLELEKRDERDEILMDF